jgi:hypothetical protein
MKKMRITWVAAIVAVGLLALAGVALAYHGTPGAATGSGSGNGTGTYTGVSDPAAAAELSALRADFVDARTAWYDEYSADRTSDEAQAALQTLRDDYQADVQAVFDEYGIDHTADTQDGNAGSDAGYGDGSGDGMTGAGTGQGAMAGDGSGDCISD